ncbi:MAG: DUF3267 domain-containing protein [Lachnospiraceae bacterium]|nr:DUF3267 domain-containing protein [Lachnospiraceae bacterium]
MAEKEERKLSKAELERKATFEVLRAGLEEQGYQMKELTMSVVAANFVAIFSALPFIIILVGLFALLNPQTNWEMGGGLEGLWMFLIVFMILIVVHELIHGFTWGMFAQSKLKAISFGFIWQYLTPYCTCKEPLKKYQMVLGSLMPTIVLGIVPGIVAALSGWVAALYMGCMLIVGGGADIVIACKIMFYKSKGKETLFYDHPYKVGTIVFERDSVVEERLESLGE